MSTEPKTVGLTEAERESLDVMGMFPTTYGFARPAEWERETEAQLVTTIERIVAAREAAVVKAMTAATDTSIITGRDPDGQRRLYHDGTPMATFTGYAAETVRNNPDMASVPVWLVSADDLDAHAAAELHRQAAAIRQRIANHGAGMRHGCDTGRSNYCEAWRLILADIEARAQALASRTVTIPHDTTNEENPCSTRP